MSTLSSNGNAAGRRSVEQRRDELIDAAVAVLAEDGLDQATTRAITDRAGLALGAFHYAFDSKEQLLAAVADRVAHTLTAHLQATLDEVDRSDDSTSGTARVASYLQRFLARYWDQLADTRQLQLARYELTVHALRKPGIHGVAARQYDRSIEALAAGIARVRGGPRDDATDALARFVVATLDGLLLQHLAGVDDDRSRPPLDRCLDAVGTVVAAHFDQAS